MIHITNAHTPSELQQIIDLQAENLKQVVPSDQAKSQGFVTLQHDFDILQKMNAPYPHIIAKDGDEVVGYALVMELQWLPHFPALHKGFELIQGMKFKEYQVDDNNFLKMGQVCVKQSHRGQLLVDKMYEYMQIQLADTYDFLLTFVSLLNPRSLRVHERCGFEILIESPEDDWAVIAWDWKK